MKAMKTLTVAMLLAAIPGCQANTASSDIGLAHSIVSNRRYVVHINNFVGNSTATINRYGPTFTSLVSAVWTRLGVQGHTFDIRASTPASLVNTVAEENADFVFTQPAHIAKLKQDHDYEIVASLENMRLGEAQSRFGGVIITHENHTNINVVEDCVAPPVSIAAISKGGFGGFAVQAKHLLDQGVSPSFMNDPGLIFTRSQPRVIDLVANGSARCGFIRTDLLEGITARTPARTRGVRVIEPRSDASALLFPFSVTTELYPEWSVAASPTLPAAAKMLLREALLTARSTHPAAVAGQYSRFFPPVDHTSVLECMWATGLLDRPSTPASPPPQLGLAVGLPVAGVVVLAACLALARYLARPNRYAPTNGAAPIAVAYLALRGLTDMLETDSGRCEAFKRFNEHVRRSARKHGCHVAHKVGDFFAVVSDDAGTLAAFVDATSAHFNAQDWTVMENEVAQRDNSTTALSSRRQSANGDRNSQRKSHNSGSRKQSTAYNADAGAVRLASRANRASASGRLSTASGSGNSRGHSDRGSHRIADGVRRHVGRLTIALHFGQCRITHDEDVDSYEYRGESMTLCAQALDACADGQFLATEDFQEALMDASQSDCSDRITSVTGVEKLHDTTGRTIECLQYNFGGVVGMFKREGQEQVDSAAAAADQATGLLTRKRVTVAVVRVGSMQDITNRSGDAITAANTTLHERLATCARVHRGHVHAVHGELALVSFNAARPTSDQGRRALQLCNDMCDAFTDARSAQARVTCGIAVDTAYVGTAPDGSVSIVGPLMQEALHLELASRALRSPADIAVSNEQEFGKTAALQWVGLLPAKEGGRQFPRRGVLAVDQMHDEADEGEWLYLLQERDGRCKGLSDAFREFAESGDAAQALEAATGFETESKGDDANAECGAPALLAIAKTELMRLARERLSGGDSPAARALTM